MTWIMGRNLTLEGLTMEHYHAAIDDLRRAANQLGSMQAGFGQSICLVCEDSDHTAEQCWYHNPLLLAELGRKALLGEFWQCFHCGAVFLSEESARQHFGKDDEEVARCLQNLAELEP